MMKSRVIAVMCAIMVMAGVGCTDSPSPVSPDQSSGLENGGAIGSQYQIDEGLNKLDPKLQASVREDGAYELSMLVGGGGMPNSPELAALRGINVVEFEIRTPEMQPIDFRRTDDIISSGVARDDGFTSITATASVELSPPANLQAGSSVEMTIYTDDGVVKRSSTLPVQ
jgi:hypothetical protein